MTLGCALSACGGGGGGGAPTQAAKVAPPALPKIIHIGLFGDSTMVGYNDMETITHSPTVELQADFDAKYGPGQVVVTDDAVSSTDSFMLLAGTVGNLGPWPNPVNNASPSFDIIVVNYGMNDMQQQHDVGQYAAALTSIVTMARAASGNPVVVLETQNPATATGKYSAPWKPLAQPPYVQAMKDVATQQNTPLADAYDYVLTLQNYQTFIPDGIHPDDGLYKAIADNSLFPVLDAIVAKERAAG
jgi:acyl-CoA thioesterase I